MNDAQRNNRNNTRFILIACAIGIVVALIGCIMTAPAKAQDRPMGFNERLVTEFIEAGRKCDRNDSAMCERVQVLCPVMTPERKRELYNFIRNDYPFKAKNGGMNITTRYTMTLRKCSAPQQAWERLDTTAARG